MSYISDWAKQMGMHDTWEQRNAQRQAQERLEREEAEAAARELEARNQAEQRRRQRLAAQRQKVEQRKLEVACLRADSVTTQIERWWSTLSPEQRSIPRAFDELRRLLHGLDIGTRPHNAALADALRKAGWRRARDWRSRNGSFRAWWYPPAGDTREDDMSDFGWYD
ncbi:MAG TPA: hypothetical protein VIH96_11715 [Paraburkholderia sp.]|jgi:hypothetical protein